MRLNRHKIKFPPVNNEVYWAAITYYRHWISSDGPWTLEVQRKTMTPKMLTKISIRYNIMRGVSSKDDNGKKTKVHQENLCDLLNEAAKDWPRKILERSDKCACIASEAEQKGCFRNFQGSAVSKLMWFLRPNDWTMFDNLAANGIGIQRNASSQARMDEFYKALDEKKLPTLWRKMQRIIESGYLKGMPAARVIDNLLMNHKLQDPDHSRSDIAKLWLGLLDSGQAKNIHKVAVDLQQKFGTEVENCLEL